MPHERQSQRVSGFYTNIILVILLLLAYPIWALTVNVITRQVSASVSREMEAAVNAVNRSNQLVVEEIRAQVEAEQQRQARRQQEQSMLELLQMESGSLDSLDTMPSREELLQQFLRSGQSSQPEPPAETP